MTPNVTRSHLGAGTKTPAANTATPATQQRWRLIFDIWPEIPAGHGSMQVRGIGKIDRRTQVGRLPVAERVNLFVGLGQSAVTTLMRGLNPSSSSDARLIRTSVSEPHAFAAVFDRHARSIWSYSCRRIGPSAADEIVSETFLRAFSHRSMYDFRQPDARPWLYGIAINVLREHARNEARSHRDAERPGDRDLADSELDRVEARTDAAARVPATAAALALLEPVDRETLLLYALAELSYGQIAIAMAVPTGTVRSRLNRARRLMQTQLGRVGTDQDQVSEAQDERSWT